MKAFIRKIALMMAVLCLILAGCGESGGTPAVTVPTEEPTAAMSPRGDVTILFTGGLEEFFARDGRLGTVGYAALMAYYDSLEEDGPVILVDGGDSLVPENEYGDGADLWNLAGLLHYDVRVPGDLELSQGQEAFSDRAKKLKDTAWVACGLGVDGVSDYTLVETGEAVIGLVGVTAPGLMTEQQAYYDQVQEAVDAAEHAGADLVILVGNLGTDPQDAPFTAPEVIAHVTGIAAFLDCGSETLIHGTMIRDKDDFEVPLYTVGRQFRYVLRLDVDLAAGTVTGKRVHDLEAENKTLRTKAEKLLKDRQPDPTEPPTEETHETTEPEA